MSELMIRPIREEDVSQIHEIEKECFAMPWSEESILHDVKENVVARWLVLDDGEGNVLAYAGMWFVLDEAHVCNVAVRPDCRGKGYGKRIFQALIDLAMENSMAMITLEVRRSNIASGIMRIIKRTRSSCTAISSILKTVKSRRKSYRRHTIRRTRAVNRHCPLFFWRKMEYNIRIRNHGDD